MTAPWPACENAASVPAQANLARRLVRRPAPALLGHRPRRGVLTQSPALAVPPLGHGPAEYGPGGQGGHVPHRGDLELAEPGEDVPDEDKQRQVHRSGRAGQPWPV